MLPIFYLDRYIDDLGSAGIMGCEECWPVIFALWGRSIEYDRRCTVRVDLAFTLNGVLHGPRENCTFIKDERHKQTEMF